MNHDSHTRISNGLRHQAALAVAAFVALLLLPVAAHAAVVSSDGTTARFEGGADAESVIVDVEFSDEISFSGEGIVAGPGCNGGYYGVNCPNSPGGIEMRMGGGDDVVTSIITSPRPAALSVDLGDGNDVFSGQEEDDAVAGGAGDDQIVSRGGADALDGGPGDDALEAGGSADRVAGGEGDDRLSGDTTESRSADVIDGGPGTDSLDDYYTGADPATAPRVTITLGGGADDGLPGEGDDLRGIERVQASSALDFSGDDGPNQAVAAEVGGSSTLRGLGAADVLTGTNHDDLIDGGSGDDVLTGGYGNDSIVGGPGRDTIDADRTARCNEMHCDLDPGSSADTIDARDGAVDTIACGPGPDRVRADGADVVAADCETVERSGGGGGKAKLALARKTRLGAALARGVKIRVSGATPGATIKLVGNVGKRVLARGSGRASNAGSATVTLRFTKAATRSLRRRQSVKLSVSGAGARTVLALHR